MSTVHPGNRAFPTEAGEPRISMLGTNAIVCEAGGALNDEDQRRVWTLAEQIAGWEHVFEVVPCMNNLMVVFDPVAVPAPGLQARIRAAWTACPARPRPGRLIEIPVVYGGEYGMDLDYVAAQTDMSVDEVIHRHSAASYTVYAVGSQPGAAYIGGLDPKLFIPRRPEPRIRVQGGTVCIAGLQTAVLVWTAPCGWHLIGHTPTAFFDASSEPPALLEPGDRIKFTVDRVER